MYVRVKMGGIVLIFRWVGGERWAVLSKRALFSTVRTFSCHRIKEKESRREERGNRD